MSANYWASTQCNNWLLDRPQLELARKEDLRYASRLECAALGVFFSNLLSIICKRLNLRQRVTATANVFFRRFFSKNSFSAVDPFLVCATCVYVSAKVEESPIHIKSAVAEAARTFTEHGFRAMPTDNSSLAEMEFYLLEEMEFDMVVFHAYRSLIVLFEGFGTSGGGGGGAASGSAGAVMGLGIEAEAFGVTRNLASTEEADAASGMANETGIRLKEFNDEVLIMSWLVLNDTYKTDIPLMHPPYMIALASLYLGLSLHLPSCEKINASLRTTLDQRSSHHRSLSSILENPTSHPSDLFSANPEPLPPTNDALTFFASLNVSLPILAEVVQEMLSGYSVQNQTARLVQDAPGMVKLCERMRESRRLDLMARARERRRNGAAHG